MANAVWKHTAKPEDPYVHAYWDRLRELDYDFLRGGGPEAIAAALRFTLSVPGLHTAIVGTTKPGRWRENAEMLKAGALPPEEFEAIRAKWGEVARPDWGGEV